MTIWLAPIGWIFLNPPKVALMSVSTLLSTSSKVFTSFTYLVSQSLLRARQLDRVDFTDLVDLALLIPYLSSTLGTSLLSRYRPTSLPVGLFPMVFTYSLISCGVSSISECRADRLGKAGGGLSGV